MTLLQLMLTFFYVGIFTIGGGLVAITLMYGPIVEGGLISSEQFYNMVAISESTPGPIGINMATYIGYQLYGVAGGIATTAATVLPSLLIIMIIARFFNRFQEKPLVKAAFTGLRPATSGMVLVATVQVFVIAILNIPAFRETGQLPQLVRLPPAAFYLLACIVLFKTKISPIAVVAAGALFGILFL